MDSGVGNVYRPDVVLYIFFFFVCSWGASMVVIASLDFYIYIYIYSFSQSIVCAQVYF